MNDINKKTSNIPKEDTPGERNIFVSIIAILLLAIAGITIIQGKIEKGILVNGKKISDKNNNKDEKCVYITGEVKKEGIVCVDKEENISKAISEAGGITKDADISIIDVNRKTIDGEKLHIISKDNSKVDDERVEEENSKLSDEVISSDKVNINTATREELDTLKGIGSETADKIIEYRNNNIFESIEDLKNVSGIGDAKYKEVKESICVK